MKKPGGDNSCLKRNSVEIVLILLTLAMIAGIEIKQPYFFLKGDNLDQNLPYYVHNLRSLMAGEFPLFNFHQFLGTPVFACVQSAALYLPNYVALLLSRTLFGDYFAMMEIIAAFHLVLAATGMFRLMKQFNLSGAASVFGAVAWTFCGSAMRVGSEWIQVVGHAGYFPWILLYSLRLSRNFGWPAFSMITFLRLMALFLGSPPYFLYMFTFDILAAPILALTATAGRSPRSRISVVLKSVGIHGFSYLCVALLAAPQLFPAFRQMMESAGRNTPLTWEQYARVGSTWSNWISGLLMNFVDVDSKCSHIGILTVVFCVAALLYRGDSRKCLPGFAALALVALLWANNTFITKLVYQVPLYNRQRFPLKLLFFANFFLVLLSGFGFHRLQEKLQEKKVKVASALVLFALALHVAVLHLANSGPPQVKGKDLVRFDPSAGQLKGGRIVTVVGSQGISDYDKPMNLLGFNYATLFGLHHFAGYETLLSKNNEEASLGLNSSGDFFVDGKASFDPTAEDLRYFREWGVRWYVLDPGVKVDAPEQLVPFSRDAGRTILGDHGARPLVYWEDTASAEEISHRFTGNSIRVATGRDSDGPLVINVLHHPFFTATVDGKAASIRRAERGNMVLHVQGGRREINIVYSDPYFVAGVRVAGSFLLLTGVLAVARRFTRRNDKGVGGFSGGEGKGLATSESTAR